MGRLLGHTATNRGKKVLVKMKSGVTFVDRFRERTQKYIFFYDHRKVLKSDIEFFTILKLQKK